MTFFVTANDLFWHFPPVWPTLLMLPFSLMVYGQFFGSVWIKCPICGTGFKKRMNPLKWYTRCTNCEASIVPGLALWIIAKGANRRPPWDIFAFEAGTWRTHQPVNMCFCYSCGKQISEDVRNGKPTVKPAKRRIRTPKM